MLEKLCSLKQRIAEMQYVVNQLLQEQDEFKMEEMIYDLPLAQMLAWWFIFLRVVAHH